MTRTSAAPPPPPLEHAHLPPPPHIRSIHKILQRSPTGTTPPDSEAPPVLDFSGYDGTLDSIPEYHRQRLELTGSIATSTLQSAYKHLDDSAPLPAEAVPIYTHTSVPGLRILPGLLPPATQTQLLTSLLHRDLSNTSTHSTNLHLHYHVPPTPFSFFTLPTTTTLLPKDPTIHKPLPLSRALTKKLRWMTLGGQYDWTKKEYPERAPGEEPPFPADVAGLVSELFPDVTPQAAILNVYAPADTLAPHRDVSEASNAPLVSISVGCAGVFVIGLDGEDTEVLAVRLGSGDAVVMAGESRWAWHSVPKILKGTCPEVIAGWPGGETEWGNWLEGRRINLNIRQMWD